MEDRRRSDDKNWDEVKSFIHFQQIANEESKSYREKDAILQKYQAEKLESLDTRVMIQNGRVVKLEKQQEETDTKIKQRNNFWSKFQAWMTVIATVVMAVSACIMIYKK